ncbi:DUF397 domain-containing protein [Saccharopolyspora sp. HNM0986]|uniref:DUF397 domain-containing protein n=1 Tax=Saccharopolyspora galaxeae TaxID=2781241 RepID=UPI00190D555E|nr:DUF397 domain-containing protein [Saccharopolyspora sp. HNM0986]MBK0869521.1 DUF397 domain-containing protein [Saccharopolyspora sp. HNM0986]
MTAHVGPDAIWRKSAHSNANGGACVEVAVGVRRAAVRDSKQGVAGPVLAFGAASFGSFLSAVKAGKLDR